MWYVDKGIGVGLMVCLVGKVNIQQTRSRVHAEFQLTWRIFRLPVTRAPKKVATTQKKVFKVNKQYVIFSYIELNEIG